MHAKTPACQILEVAISTFMLVLVISMGYKLWAGPMPQSLFEPSACRKHRPSFPCFRQSEMRHLNGQFIPCCAKSLLLPATSSVRSSSARPLTLYKKLFMPDSLLHACQHASKRCFHEDRQFCARPTSPRSPFPPAILLAAEETGSDLEQSWTALEAERLPHRRLVV